MPEKIRMELNNGATLVGDYYDSPSNKGVFLFPGFTEHRSSLEETAKTLNSEFKTWTFDINSQGESSGNWDLREMNESIFELLHESKKRYGLSKIGAHGNSVGGMAIGLTAADIGNDIDCISLSSTPAALQDVLPKYASIILGSVPQSVVRAGTILFDKMESRNNSNYAKKSHAQFFENGEYKPYAQLGALKIYSIKDFTNWISNAPQIGGIVSNIAAPTLMIYGGNDSLLGIKNDVLPDRLENLFYSMGSSDKKIIIFSGADHSLNTTTKTDDCFNQDPKYQNVKKEIFNHFSYYLL
jgi:alpha-beta hydrolase superfamily lysophospholipase